MSEAVSTRDEWGTATLADLAASITSGATPEAGNRRYYTLDGGYAFAKIEDLTRARTHEIEHCGLQITDAAVRETAAKIYPAGTILLSMYGTIGLAKVCTRSLTANQALCALLPPFRCDSGYLLHHLDYVRPQWSRYSGQTTQANINAAIVRVHAVPLPPIGDQVAIRQVLDTLDTTIRQTEAIIEKLRQVKQGLLHDLLTRGIDANGELRPPQSQAPHLYKESPLGWIPRAWSVELLDDVAMRGSGHTPSKSVASYWNGGVRWVSLADSHRLDQIYIDETDKEISDLGIANSSAVKHPSGTVILSRDAGVGKSAVLGAEMAVSQHFMAWRCGARLNNLFLYFKLQHMKPSFEAIALGSTVKTIGLDYFRRLRITVPGRPEQDIAVEVLMASEREVRTHQAELGKLRLMKSGLMGDLLTGRVRVTPLLAPATN
jgi:type I restriction enzyme S subunit